jgi:hypothetical protein
MASEAAVFAADIVVEAALRRFVAGEIDGSLVDGLLVQVLRRTSCGASHWCVAVKYHALLLATIASFLVNNALLLVDNCASVGQ